MRYSLLQLSRSFHAAPQHRAAVCSAAFTFILKLLKMCYQKIVSKSVWIHSGFHKRGVRHQACRLVRELFISLQSTLWNVRKAGYRLRRSRYKQSLRDGEKKITEKTPHNQITFSFFFFYILEEVLEEAFRTRRTVSAFLSVLHSVGFSSLSAPEATLHVTVLYVCVWVFFFFSPPKNSTSSNSGFHVS